MNKPSVHSIGLEALLFLGLILLPYFGISFGIQWAFFTFFIPKNSISFSEVLAAHGMTFLITVVTIMLFMHYRDNFEPLFFIIPCINAIAQMLFYYKPYQSMRHIRGIVLAANGIAGVVDALFIFYCFDWIMSVIF
ncbi:MAG: hypothetical protein WD068_01235 [Candidatus Babeliales bacterium]